MKNLPTYLSSCANLQLLFNICLSILHKYIHLYVKLKTIVMTFIKQNNSKLFEYPVMHLMLEVF